MIGFDLTTLNIMADCVEEVNDKSVPELILVKKIISRKSGGYKRIWKLKRMEEVDGVIVEEKRTSKKKKNAD